MEIHRPLVTLEKNFIILVILLPSSSLFRHLPENMLHKNWQHEQIPITTGRQGVEVLLSKVSYLDELESLVYNGH